VKDLHGMCAEWAEFGECEKNPGYMLQNCMKSCSEGHQEVPIPQSFYELVSNDIDGNPISFSQFEGKVVYLINVASMCGYTASNYAEFKTLSEFKNDGLEILIFPCDQFGKKLIKRVHVTKYYSRIVYNS
jgi:hypothetical protein